MKFVKSTTIIVALIVINQSPIFSQTDDVALIKSEINKSVDAYNKKNLERAISIYSEDYIGYYSGHTDQTKASMKDEFKKVFDNKYLDAKQKVEIVEVKVGSNLSFVRINILWIYKPTMASAAQTAREKNLQVWEKQSTGEWQIIRASTIPVDVKKKTK